MIIYKITNTKTNKIYIGQTTKTLDKRWANHVARFNAYTKTKKGGYHLYKSMAKHGIENFVIEEIARASTQQELDSMEIRYIKEYNATEDGYNLSIGGDIEPMRSPKVYERHGEVMRSKDVRERISQSMKEYHKNNKVSKETRALLSKRMNERRARGEVFATTFREEDIRKATLAKQKPVEITYRGVTTKFDSIKLSCKYLVETHFPEHTIKYLQRQATESIRSGEDRKGVVWRLL